MEHLQSERIQSIAQRLLERLEEQIESGQLDYAAIKQICATMKDLKDLVQPKSKSDEGGITVVLDEELETLSK